MAAELPADGSAMKKIKLASRCFMGGGTPTLSERLFEGRAFRFARSRVHRFDSAFLLPENFRTYHLGRTSAEFAASQKGQFGFYAH